METLFIADDEFAIREGLKCIIDWESLGFKLCGEASNGEDALTQILALNPSLVLLDVKMPKLHGTEVIRLAREAGFHGKCIILSGYSDFKYAQEAIKSGVRFYLTKPLDEDELYQAVSEIRVLIQSEKEHSEHLTALKNRAKSVILYELVTNTLSAPLTAEDAENLRLTADSYQIVICEDFNKRSATAPYTFAELLKVTNKENNIFEHIEADNKDIVLLKGTHGLNKLADFLEHFEHQPLQKGSPMGSMFITYGRPVSSLQDIHLSYEDASTLLGRRFFCAQEQHALGYEALPAELSKNAGDSSQEKILVLNEELASSFTNRFIDFIQSYNRKMVVATLSELEDTMSQVSDDINTIKLFLTDIYLQIRERMNRNYASAEIPFAANSTVIDFINSQNYLYEIIRFLSEQFEMIMNATGNPSRDTILDDVLFYIDHNFKSNIKLETIAPLFGYNSAYLGKIFNKTVGESFNSYVDHRRIEHSKQLLLENKLKVYEIAEQVGYKNVDYFHKKFKKYVGESPAEFRKQMEPGQSDD
ncbi:MAG: response regulator [Lachnospiraceae bacterium]|nr:response regulator [Lachnospiraceae bacterium]